MIIVSSIITLIAIGFGAYALFLTSKVSGDNLLRIESELGYRYATTYRTWQLIAWGVVLVALLAWTVTIVLLVRRHNKKKKLQLANPVPVAPQSGQEQKQQMLIQAGQQSPQSGQGQPQKQQMPIQARQQSPRFGQGQPQKQESTSAVGEHKCPKCGKPVLVNAVFCGTCGQSLSAPATNARAHVSKQPQTPLANRSHPATSSQPMKNCQVCGKKIVSNAMFCPFCGNRPDSGISI